MPDDPSSSLPSHLTHLPERKRAQDLELRQRYGDRLLWLLGIQILLADAVFVASAWVGQNWALPAGVIEVWLAATVVQVVGVVGIIARHLFPNRDGRAATP